MADKRVSNSSTISNSKRRKFEKTNNKTSFENLSNEIYYEIFDYIHPYTIYKVFSNLNLRFRQLIDSPMLSLRISLDKMSQTHFEYCRNQIIIPNKHRIISLHLHNCNLIEKFLWSCAFDSSFSRLQSLELFELEPTTMTGFRILATLQSLPRLLKLSIEFTDDRYVYLEKVYEQLLRIPSLKYLFLAADDYRLNPLQSSLNSERFSKIETLTVDHYCTIDALLSILHYTTRLKRLNCLSLFESEWDKTTKEISINVPYLTHVDIADCRVEFDHLAVLLARLGSQLKSLDIWNSSYSYHHNYPNQWERLISRHMPHLYRCNIYWPIIIYDNHEDLQSDAFVHQFNSPFWFEHNWIISIDIELERIFYQISPNEYSDKLYNENRKMITDSAQNTNYHWANSTNNVARQTTNDLSSKVSSVKLSIRNERKLTLSRSIIQTLLPVLNAIEIGSLHLVWANISLSDFLELLSHLPNLHSLTWFSPVNIDMNHLATEDEEKLRLLSINNRITKVSFEMTFEQIQFLITLCPRIEELEVHAVKQKDLEKLIRFILIETGTNLLYLHSLLLNIIDINDETVYNLQTLIDSEDLLPNYMIKKYHANFIALQWKIQ